MTRRRSLVVTVVTAVALAAAGCGAPPPGQVRHVEPSEVPYALLSPAPTDEPDQAELSTMLAATTPVYFVVEEDRLEALDEPVQPGPVAEVAEQALELLANGPTDAERESGYASALGRGADLTLEDVRGGTATVEVDLTGDPAADQLPLVVGQIVLTLASIEGVDRVLLVQDGDPVEMALPGGARTNEPVGAGDYQGLLVGAPTTTP